jgi:hypothetical protein
MSNDYLQAAILGSKAERERVINYLERRAGELKECGKDDDCNDIWHYVIGLIEDIKEGEH